MSHMMCLSLSSLNEVTWMPMAVVVTKAKDDTTPKFYQILRKGSESSCSWFVDDFIMEDGSLLCLCPIDPLFLLLTIVSSSGRSDVFQSWSQVLNQSLLHLKATEKQKHVIVQTFHQSWVSKDLVTICDTQFIEESLMMRPNENKICTWLERKLDSILLIFDHQQVSRTIYTHRYGTTTSFETNKKKHIAFEIVKEYISIEIASKFETHLNFHNDEPVSMSLEVSEAIKENILLNSSNLMERDKHWKNGMPVASGSVDHSKLAPSNNFYDERIKAELKQPKTKKQKIIDARGMKPITSMFGVKPKDTQ